MTKASPFVFHSFFVSSSAMSSRPAPIGNNQPGNGSLLPPPRRRINDDDARGAAKDVIRRPQQAKKKKKKDPFMLEENSAAPAAPVLHCCCELIDRDLKAPRAHARSQDQDQNAHATTGKEPKQDKPEKKKKKDLLNDVGSGAESLANVRPLVRHHGEIAAGRVVRVQLEEATTPAALAQEWRALPAAVIGRRRPNAATGIHGHSRPSVWYAPESARPGSPHKKEDNNKEAALELSNKRRAGGKHYAGQPVDFGAPYQVPMAGGKDGREATGWLHVGQGQ